MLIGHHNLPGELPWAVSMLKNVLKDEIGNGRSLAGTGFWLQTGDGHTVLATNRHLVDPALAFPGDPILAKCNVVATEVHVRQGDDTSLLYAPGRFFRVIDPYWIWDREADAAILVDPKLDGYPPTDQMFRIVALPESLLADGAWINTKLQMMDECFFIGYPSVPKDSKDDSGEPTHLYDVPMTFPIARQAIIASSPFFTHKDIKTTGVMLVSGLSFHGSSGSPVVTPLLGVPPGSVTTKPMEDFPEYEHMPLALVTDYREPRVIGIMTGKFETKEIDRVFTHAGLSYFTRAGYLSALIKQAREGGWKPPAV